MRHPSAFLTPIVAGAAILSGCAQDHRSTSVAGTPATATHAQPVAVRLTWSDAPVTVTHSPAVPPVPEITGIRYAGHPEGGYDRIVLDITGAGLPGYSARYVTEVRADGSDRPIAVPGRRYLLIVLNPAQAHSLSGVHPIGLPMLKAYAIAGDFEGHVTIALGLGATTGYRIGELPGRLYVDVAR